MKEEKDNIYTEIVAKAESYLANNGYGSETNYTTNHVAWLMATFAKLHYQQKLAEMMPENGCKIIERLNAAVPLTQGVNPIQWDGATFHIKLKGNEINELVEILSLFKKEEKL